MPRHPIDRHRPVVWRRSNVRPSALGRDREPAADCLAGRILREVRRTDEWCLVAPQVRRLNWAFTPNAAAVMQLVRLGLVEVDYQPARWLTENVWVRAL